MVGTGQPSVVSLDKAGELLLFYTRGDAAGTRMVVRELDLLSLEAPVIGTERELSRAGLTESDGSAVILHNGALARDAISGGFFLVRERHPFDSATPSFISAVLQVAATDSTDPAVSGATWRLVGQIDAARSGRPRNHNASIVKDAYGSPRIRRQSRSRTRFRTSAAGICGRTASAPRRSRSPATPRP